MEFLSANYCDTSGSITVDSGTITSENLISRDLTRQWSSDGYADDLLTSLVTISFAETLSVDRIAIMGTNIKGFDLYYNGSTANAFTPDAGTTTSRWSGNTEESIYIRTAAVNCTSVTLAMKTTQVADSEKAIGHLYIGRQILDFERDPVANSYTPSIVPTEVVHKMSDGGKRLHRVSEKFTAKLKLEYVSGSFRNQLKDVYDLRDPFVFCPFGTQTGWDEVLFEVVWTGAFTFFKFADNHAGAGFDGSIMLEETTR